jgi:hypothetical protein
VLDIVEEKDEEELKEEGKSDEDKPPTIDVSPADRSGLVTPTPTPMPTPNPAGFESRTNSNSPVPVLKKQHSKPDLSAMLAKVKNKPPPSPASAEEKPRSTESPPVAAPATVFVQEEKREEKKEITVTMAVPRPENFPIPPPIPSVWPPKPYSPPGPAVSCVAPSSDLSSTTAKDQSPSEKSSSGKSKKKITKQVVITEPPKPLPEGYYVAATDKGVSPFDILPAGTTDETSLMELQVKFEEDSTPYSTVQFMSSTSPIGSSSPAHSNPEDEGTNTNKRDPIKDYASSRDYSDINIKNKIYMEDLPVPVGYLATVHRLKKNVEKRKEILRQQKELELRSEEVLLFNETSPKKPFRPTVPEEFSFSTQQYYETKLRTFRKDPGQTEVDKLPLSDRVEEDVVHQTIHRYGKVDRSAAYWLQTLRSETQQSLDSSRISGTRGDCSVLTEPKPPKLLSNEVVLRRQLEKDMKKMEENQTEYYFQQLNNIKKKHLKEKALQQAKEVGVYKPHNRYRLHQKMVEKYSHKPEIGRLNLEEVTQKAFENYYLSSGVTSYASETSNFSPDYPRWENLGDDLSLNQSQYQVQPPSPYFMRQHHQHQQRHQQQQPHKPHDLHSNNHRKSRATNFDDLLEEYS